MSVNQERVPVVTAEAIQVRPAIRVALSTLVTVVKSLVSVGGEDQRTWARIERVDWSPVVRHEPTLPDWYRGFRS